jgi:hypothetical protein|tara:strand:+ start:15444 stop:15893 length:450 start_codon:yes stop_codon:yes gene_type:complete
MSGSKSPIKHASSLMSDPDSALHTLFKQTQTLQRLQQLVYRYLPLSTQPHIRVATYREGVLHLLTDSAHWITRLRYQESELIEKLASHQSFQDLGRIRLTVKPWYAPTDNQRPATPISAHNAKQMAAVAKYIEDKPLRKALIKLSHNSD